MSADPIVYAKQYLEDILSFFGLNVDVSAKQNEDVIELSVPSSHLNGFLIGQRGETLRALQSLVGTALKNQDYQEARVNIDVADYKRHHRERLARQVKAWIDEVKASNEPMHVRPMNAADRRVVHHTVGEDSGVTSGSEGEGRDRHVVITPVGSSAASTDTAESKEE